MKTIKKKRPVGTGTRCKRYVAFHEAGHAVAADYYGVDFTVTVDGRPHIAFGSTFVEYACHIVFAGPLAQAKVQKRGLSYALLLGGHYDMEYINAEAERYGAPAFADPWRTIWKKSAQRIIKTRWDLVEAVAERLMSCGTLSSDEVREIALSSGHNLQCLMRPYD